MSLITFVEKTIGIKKSTKKNVSCDLLLMFKKNSNILISCIICVDALNVNAAGSARGLA